MFQKQLAVKWCVFKSTVTYHRQAMEVWESMPTPFPSSRAKPMGLLPAPRGSCVKVRPPSISPTVERPTTAVPSYGSRSERSILSAAEVCWHPRHLSGLSKEDVEKEGEALTPESSNLQLQEDSFFANTFPGFLPPVIFTES